MNDARGFFHHRAELAWGRMSFCGKSRYENHVGIYYTDVCVNCSSTMPPQRAALPLSRKCTVLPATTARARRGAVEHGEVCTHTYYVRPNLAAQSGGPNVKSFPFQHEEPSSSPASILCLRTTPRQFKVVFVVSELRIIAPMNFLSKCNFRRRLVNTWRPQMPCGPKIMPVSNMTEKILRLLKKMF